MEIVSAYLLDIVILLTAAMIAVPLFKNIKLGAVTGFLVAGMVVGPYGMGWVSHQEGIAHLAEIGVVFLLFLIGIELNPSRLWQMRRMVFGLGALQVVLTGGVLVALLNGVFNVPLKSAILIGPALALSSTAFVLQLLSEHKQLTSTKGRNALAILLFQDLAVVPLLVLIPLLSAPEMNLSKDLGIALVESILILVVVIAAGRYLLHPLLHRVAVSGNNEVFTTSALLIVLGTAYATEHAGLSMAMGAFLAGLLIADSSYKHQIVAEVQPFRGFLLGLFFMSMGMSLNLQLFFGEPLFFALLVLGLLLLKMLFITPLSIGFGIEKKSASALGLLLSQSGEFALVLFSLAYQAGIFSEHLYQQLIVVVVLSLISTPAMSALSDKIKPKVKTPETIDIEAHPIVLAGYGRVGRLIGDILAKANQRFIAVDADPNRVDSLRKLGHPVYYGDVANPTLLKSIGASSASVIIVTLNDPNATANLVATLAQQNPESKIFARGHRISHCEELAKLGATGTVAENLEVSLELATMALRASDVKAEFAFDTVDKVRQDFHARLKGDVQTITTDDQAIAKSKK